VLEGTVVAVAFDGSHRFSKPTAPAIRLLEGIGVEGDAHAGVTVQHRSRVARDPSQPNLRQVHLVHAELLDEVREDGFDVPPGAMGENVTTRGLDLLALPAGAVLELGDSAAIAVTGLRNPCVQLDGYAAGLMRRMVGRTEDGTIVRRAGVMAVVLRGGTVVPGDSIRVRLPAEHRPLQPV
jgi:MOSC domain-containing protein YiiM